MKNIFKEIRIDNFNTFYGSILQNPDIVLQKTGKHLENMKELTYDSHVWSSIQSRKSGVLSLDWYINEDSKTSEIKNIINKLDYEQSSKAILDAIYYGYSVLEIIWERNNDGLYPKKLKAHSPNHFAFDQNGKIQLANSNKHTINNYKLLVAVNEPSFSNPYGEAVLTRCFWPVKFKNAGFRFWANYMERFGSPLVIGKYPRGTSTEDAEELLDHLTNLSEDSAIVSPDDVSLEIKDSNNYGTSAMYSEMIDKCNAEISKAILSQTLTSEVKSGSKAAAETHLKVRSEIIESDAKLLESIWNKLIGYIYELNLIGGDLPVFKIDRSELESAFKLERDKTLVKDCGLSLNKNYWMRNYNIKESDLE